MLGYISSTRKKSCRACVKAKRRCDLGYPLCKRCFTKGLDCAYPNALSEAEVVVRQTTPDFQLPATTEEAVVSPALPGHPISSVPGACIGHHYGPPPLLTSESSGSSSPEAIARDDLAHSVLETLLPQVWEPRVLEERQLRNIISELTGFVPAMAYSGHTPFMHKALYKKWQPATYQDSCSLSALYMLKTQHNSHTLVNSINAKILDMIKSSTNWTLAEHLAAVQALIIYQIIRLFNPDLKQQPLADKQNALLELWTATLWKRSFNERPTFASQFEGWAFEESLRRTVLLSVFVRGAWCSVMKNGLCEQVPVLARLPLARDVELWDLDAEEWEKRRERGGKDGELIAYGDYSWSWRPDRSVEDLSQFERLLLVACKGDSDSRLLTI